MTAQTSELEPTDSTQPYHVHPSNLSDHAAELVLRIERLNIAVQKQKLIRPLIHEVSFSIAKGETLALVGESGSGKSVTASAVAGLLPNSLRITSGSIQFQGEDILARQEKQRTQLRGTRIGWIFQNYQGSFTPFLTIGSQLTEMLRTHRKLSRRAAKELVLSWLDQAALPAERVYASYPFQISGGQRQRAAIAAALMLEPSLVIADEPTTALDVITGERVLELMMDLQRLTGCAILFISHDLRHVMKRADRIAVMKEGRIMELGEPKQIREQPRHPYTKQLLDACPKLEVPPRLW
ncbi:ABC transporter ATP-binding protein [Paenibacillus sp. 1011MAR3C5]|uniref:ATP-binding cassette domain-containing protein n=1 Tax=Paenibacillus sp. 1011MAR3C5 TaxID=1675787 RepID=UPI000E6BCE98|nr:ABC transporter ATP-binding protein [Paenibacillus sp. 1011MAR3C5]RJE87014.1 ABC transporter ATP-binding protein [Paenibacillus sp. 1011MAR3C5]